MNVLVVDDVDANRSALKAILSGTDYKIIEAGSGPDALRKLLDDEFAVLLLDVVMPEMNGFKLAEMIRTREKTAKIPIVFVTGQATDIDFVFRGYRAGAVDYLVKPLDPQVVRAKVAVFAELYRQRKTIEASLREKEILLREIHHRVKNNLQIISSLLNLQGQLQSPAVQSLFLDSGARVRSIALVHESLYQTETLADANIDTYLRALVDGLVQTYGSINTSVTVEEHGVRLSIDTAILCGLIVNELVSNSLKHGFPENRPGKISVSISEPTPKTFELAVRDDGVGIPADVDINHSMTMGLQVIHSLADQLNGTITFNRNGGGTFVRLVFPKPRA